MVVGRGLRRCRPVPAEPGVRVRNQVNLVSGWILGYAVLAMVVLTDPWVLTYEPRDDTLSSSLAFLGFFGAVSLVGSRCFAHPRLDVTPDGQLVVTGVLRTISAPLALVAEVDLTSRDHVRLRVQGRWYAVAALEVRQLDLARSGSTPSETLHALFGSGRLPHPAELEGAVRAGPSAPRGAEVVLWVLWLIYLVLGVLLTPLL